MKKRLPQGSAGILLGLAPAAVSRRREAASPYRGVKMWAGCPLSLKEKLLFCPLNNL